MICTISIPRSPYRPSRVVGVASKSSMLRVSNAWGVYVNRETYSRASPVAGLAVEPPPWGVYCGVTVTMRLTGGVIAPLVRLRIWAWIATNCPGRLIVAATSGRCCQSSNS